jgi:methyltransferase (TIGR00027 family)
LQLLTALPNTFQLALQLTTRGTILAHLLTGFVPKGYRFPFEGEPTFSQEPTARTAFFDASLERHLGNIDQLVILGAGWDTRSFRMPKRIYCFEIDTPKTQETKRELLKKAGLDTTNVTFVPANFNTDDWLENLIQAGFDPKKPAFFLWEGVTMYLDKEAVERFLRQALGTVTPCFSSQA